MSKAYNRVDWDFLKNVFTRFSFSDTWIDMVLRLVSGNWYSILINSHRRGFFHSTRGSKHGDPLSPSLFLLGDEVLSKLLNRLPLHPQFFGFQMQPRGPQITHLAYADDVIIFIARTRSSIELVLQQLRCPLYVGRKKIVLFNEVVSKIVRKTNGWQGKLLSIGGRAVLIKHVFQSQPLHLLAAINPPKTVIKQIEAYLAKFFWGSSDGKNRYHWSSWDNLCYPTKEGGLGFRRIIDISESFAYKRWWRFRSVKTLWSDFLLAKYCKRVGPVERKYQSGQSHCWKKFMEIKFEAEKNILWRINRGDISLWWDNWTGQGALAFMVETAGANLKLLVKDARIDGEWAFPELHQLPEYIIELINSIEVGDPDIPDLAIWMSSVPGVPLNSVRKRCMFPTVYQIFFHLKWILAKYDMNFDWESRWPEICNTLMNSRDEFKCTIIKWERPELNWVKLNTDGSKFGDGHIGAGGVIRDFAGHMHMDFTKSLDTGSHNYAEAKASLFGLRWCKENGLHNVILECDSKFVVDMLKYACAVPWQLYHIIEETRKIISQINVVTQHCFREGNQVADAMAKVSTRGQDMIVYNCNNLPKEALGPFRLDLIQMPSFRRKHVKIQFRSR
ncbi:uncharacterized protein LOC132643957 [Lycium barbarum]|uniref:uncharacterized protein LOC132643957 n=1 Tax=Lycium barbarum TaxID=112863 RepID=UPI00293EB02F|nr:uncharacterized protein LOC132643957 [Lycium barbarum]